MIEIGRQKREVIRPFCEGNQEVLIRGAMEGAIGRVWVPKSDPVACCLIVAGDFAYLMGLAPRGAQALDLKSQIYESAYEGFLYPQDERWADWLEEAFAGELRLVSRYALKKEEHHFDTELLKRYTAAVPEGIRIKRIDQRIYRLARKAAWSRDLCSFFEDESHFMEQGFGYAAMKGRELTAGCSACRVSDGMMEVQMDTRKDWRRKGLALACAAAFVLECLEKNLTPNWDAESLPSVGLAEKLGYVFEKEYQVYRFKEPKARAW